jgi:hypothetical protein
MGRRRGGNGQRSDAGHLFALLSLRRLRFVNLAVQVSLWVVDFVALFIDSQNKTNNFIKSTLALQLLVGEKACYTFFFFLKLYTSSLFIQRILGPADLNPIEFFLDLYDWIPLLLFFPKRPSNLSINILFLFLWSRPNFSAYETNVQNISWFITNMLCEFIVHADLSVYQALPPGRRLFLKSIPGHGQSGLRHGPKNRA